MEQKSLGIEELEELYVRKMEHQWLITKYPRNMEKEQQNQKN